LFYGCQKAPQFTKSLVNAAHESGLWIFGYNRSYGANIKGEIAIANFVFNQGADGFVWDAEAEWESGNAWIGMAGPNTKIIPGHGPTVDRAAVIAHRDMILGVRDRVAELVKQGKSPEEVVAAHPTSEFDAKVPPVAGSSDRFVGQLYAELKPAKQ